MQDCTREAAAKALEVAGHSYAADRVRNGHLPMKITIRTLRHANTPEAIAAITLVQQLERQSSQ